MNYDEVLKTARQEVDREWAEIEARQALDTAASYAQVAAHRTREAAREQQRRERQEAEDRAWEAMMRGEDLTKKQESVLLSSEPGRADRAATRSERRGEMPKLGTKEAAKAEPKAKKTATTYCLMTGKPTNGSRFSGLGTDAKYKSLLINTALKDPHEPVTIHDHTTGKAEKQEAIAILRKLEWLPFLEKSRASRKAKIEKANQSSAAKVAAKPAKKAAGSTSA